MPTSRHISARPGNPPLTSVGGPQQLREDAPDFRHGASGTSRDDAVMISSDEESDDEESDAGDLDDTRSDTSFPPVEELLPARRRDAGASSTADRGRSVASGAGDNDNAEEPTLVDRTNPSDGPTRTQQLPACSPGRSTASSPAAAPPRPSSASPSPLQAKQSRPIPAGCASNETGEAPPPEDAVPHASSPGVEARQTSGPGRCLSPSPLRLDEATHQEGTPRRDSARENDGHDEAESSPRTATLRPGIRRFRRMPSTESDDDDETEAVRKPRQRRRRQHDGVGMRGDDMYHLASGTDAGNESSDVGPPPPKRRKRSTAPTPFKSATGRQTGLDGGASRSRRSRTQASDARATGQPNVTDSSSSPGSSDDEGAGHVPMAEYTEWRVRDGVLQHVLVNNRPFFQLRFRVQDLSGGGEEHGRGQSSATERPSAKRGKATRVRYTAEEDEFLIAQKNQGRSWEEIHAAHKAAFPQHGRSRQTLQSHFSTKLNGASERGRQ